MARLSPVNLSPGSYNISPILAYFLSHNWTLYNISEDNVHKKKMKYMKLDKLYNMFFCFFKK